MKNGTVDNTYFNFIYLSLLLVVVEVFGGYAPKLSENKDAR